MKNQHSFPRIKPLLLWYIILYIAEFNFLNLFLKIIHLSSWVRLAGQVLITVFYWPNLFIFFERIYNFLFLHYMFGKLEHKIIWAWSLLVCSQVFFLSQKDVFSYGFNLFNCYKTMPYFKHFFLFQFLKMGSICVHFTYIVTYASLKLFMIHYCNFSCLPWPLLLLANSL